MSTEPHLPPVRTRVINWQDPSLGVQIAQTTSGLEYLQGIASGQYPAPPITDLMNIELMTVDKGQVIFGVEPAEFHYNPMGAVHGGLAATLVDSAMTCAILSTAPRGIYYTTIELHINYIRPITLDTGYLKSIGQTIHVGRRVATAEARVIDKDNKLYAHATTTCMAIHIKEDT